MFNLISFFMKKVYLLMLAILFAGQLLTAQNSGKGFNYQAIARDLNGQVLQNQTIILRFSLIPGQYASDPTWQEMQLANTDEFGAFSLIVGHGQRTGGTVSNYTDLNYASADYWLKVELKDGAEYYEISFRELLSVPYAEVARNATLFSPGMMIPFAGPLEKVPVGWFLCDGSLKNINSYPELYAAIGKAWGGNATQFNLPDCRGNFLRGVSYASGRDEDKLTRSALYTGGNTGNIVGSYQPSQFSSHSHTVVNAGSHTHTSGNYKYILQYVDGTHSCDNMDTTPGEPDVMHKMVMPNAGDHTHTVNASGGQETRSENLYVNYIIKY